MPVPETVCPRVWKRRCTYPCCNCPLSYMPEDTMTTVPPVEDYIHRRATMETSGSLAEQSARPTIPALPLSIEQRSALMQAFDISVAAKRTELNTLLKDYETWLRNNSHRHREVEDIAEAYAAEATSLIRAIRGLQAMKETARKNNIVVKADA